MEHGRHALVLSGGGARAAYQVGVLRAVSELLPDPGPLPFPILCGTSAGSLNATALVHECYLRIAKSGGEQGIGNRSHFLALAGRAMRQILVNHARERMAAKRGGGAEHTTLDQHDIAADREAEELLSVDSVLEQLGREDERMVRVVDCRIFGGLTEVETAEALRIPLRSVQRLWAQARERLQNLLVA